MLLRSRAFKIRQQHSRLPPFFQHTHPFPPLPNNIEEEENEEFDTFEIPRRNQEEETSAERLGTRLHTEENYRNSPVSLNQDVLYPKFQYSARNLSRVPQINSGQIEMSEIVE